MKHHVFSFAKTSYALTIPGSEDSVSSLRDCAKSTTANREKVLA
jgi:hypothetical protein